MLSLVFLVFSVVQSVAVKDSCGGSSCVSCGSSRACVGLSKDCSFSFGKCFNKSVECGNGACSSCLLERTCLTLNCSWWMGKCLESSAGSNLTSKKLKGILPDKIEDVKRKSNAIILSDADFSCPAQWGLSLPSQTNNDYVFTCKYELKTSSNFGVMMANGAKSYKLIECVFKDIDNSPILNVSDIQIDVTVENCIFEDVRRNGNVQLFYLKSGSSSATVTSKITSCVFRKCGLNANGHELIALHEYNVVITNSRFYSCVCSSYNLVYIGEISATQKVQINNTHFASNTVVQSGRGVVGFFSIPNPTDSITSFFGNGFCGGTSSYIIYYSSTPYVATQGTISQSCVNAGFVGSCKVWNADYTTQCMDADLVSALNQLTECSGSNTQKNCNPDELTCELIIPTGGAPRCKPHTNPCHSSSSARNRR